MTAYVLFEEDGALRAGTVLSATEAASQVELPGGRRVKVKHTHVFLRFAAPPPPQLLPLAQQEAEQIDLDFLWQCAPQQEFSFEELAREYFGGVPTAVQATAILLRLLGAPAYFHRKGRGRFRPAPPEILQAALAALERKRRQEALKQQYVADLVAGRVPEPIARQAIALLLRPDKNSIEYKALEAAAFQRQLSPLRLLLANGAIASPLRWHLDSFLAQYFPHGTGFPADLPAPPPADDLPLAEVAAFSIDDSATTEIDDAFSLRELPDGVRVGIHIAAPAVALGREHPLEPVARARLSTVYAPALKITMLPPAWINAFSLAEGRAVPVVSLYVDCAREDWLPRRFETRVERVQIAANLRHDRLDDVVTEERMAAGALGDLPFAHELTLLWRVARALLAERERVRGRPEPLGRIEYAVLVEPAGDTLDEHARVTIRPRRRGAPLDLIVAELMILANSHWGGWLAQAKRAAIYRSQSLQQGSGRVKMSTTPAPHEGMGVAHYAWSSSPLRRYVDLVNQRQILAAVRGAPAPYTGNDAELFAAISAFEAAAAAYAEFQARMERYWCLRWLRQENVQRIGAVVLKADVLRLEGLPFVTRLPGMPELARGTRLELDILSTDEIELTVQARVHRVLAEAAPAAIEADEDIGDWGEDCVASSPASTPST
ncbi:MAG: RNB domain-containing ribonuclease [Sutterellaceae bacterium]|nr:RNB domain-containing ribonuclease [Burkholderiaceae bacterium]MDW8429619.1 RNB domain-containing ribonuclease [Sutterellaceae bacterium]